MRTLFESVTQLVQGGVNQPATTVMSKGLCCRNVSSEQGVRSVVSFFLGLAYRFFRRLLSQPFRTRHEQLLQQLQGTTP